MWWNKDWSKEFNKDAFKGLMKMRKWGGLKYVVLYLLSEGPRNGAEIMEAVERMSMGAWRPSPGSIYPLLSQLSEEGLILKRDDQRYELTSAGAEEIGLSRNSHGHQHQSPYSTEGTLNELESYVLYLEDLPRERLASQEARLGRVIDRLQKLKESLHK
jgi:DNA-binding PadR family transcriptional regulator